MKKKLYLCIQLLSVLLLGACNLQKDIEIVLPAHEPQLVVECYLEPGQPYRLSVLETVSYFDTPQIPVVPDAKVFITHNGKQIELPFKISYDEQYKKYYTHSSTEIVNGKPGDVYTLEVWDGKGRRVTGTTTLLQQVPIDTIEWRYNSKDEAILLTSFQDDTNTANYYRYLVHSDSLEEGTNRDIVTDDELVKGQQITFGSAYEFEKGDTLTVTLYHIEKKYHDFLNSVSNARNSNGNPFGQPSKVKSAVSGGLGIFTSLVYDRKTVIID